MTLHEKWMRNVIAAVIAAMTVLALFALPQRADADGRGYYREYRDGRYHHNRYYPSHGGYVVVLPHDHRAFVYRGSRYYYAGGVWYRGGGSRFVIVGPPVGIVIPFLPPYYTTVWVGNVPYYYANEVYYTQAPGGYVVVDPPQAPVTQAPPSNEKLYVYPRQGQSEKQQADDRYECHRWASSQKIGRASCRERV
jgi:hypothetical protein